MPGRPNAASMMYDAFNRGQFLTYSNVDDREMLFETMYRRKLTELAMARFEWLNMPPSIDLRFLEYTLFYSGLVVVSFDINYGALVAAKARPLGSFNLYDNPKGFQTFGTNYPGQMLKQNECAPIWGTITRMGTDADIVNIYAKRLANIDRTIEINVRNARRPKAIALNEDEQLSVDNIIAALDRGDPVIKTTNSGILDRIERTLDFGVDPKSIEVLSVIRARIVNECMSMLGVDNANQDKKERLVSAEVDANAEQIDIGQNANLIPRMQGADLINRRFEILGVSGVSVRYASQTESEESYGDFYDDASGDDGISAMGGRVEEGAS